MSQSASLLDQWRSPAARRGSLARAELIDEGVVLGTRTILAYSLHNPHDEAGHDRLVALLAAATRGRVDAAASARIAKALALWRGGDKALGAIHLAQAGLPPIDPDDAYRLHLADLALNGGVAPEALLREIGCAEWLGRLMKYDPSQPRVPPGQGPRSGQWTGSNPNATARSSHAKPRAPDFADHPNIAATGGIDAICEAQYERDLVICRVVGKRSCYAQAAQRYSAYLVDKQISPLDF